MRGRPPHPSVLANYESKLGLLATALAERPGDPTMQGIVADQIARIVEYRSYLRLYNARRARREIRKQHAAALEIAAMTGEHT